MAPNTVVFDAQPGGAGEFSGSMEVNYVKYSGLNCRDYLGIFAFTMRWYLVDLSEFVPIVQVKRSTCLFPVETDPPGVQWKACGSIAAAEAELSPSWGSRPHL